MVIQTGTEPHEKITEQVKAGEVQQTSEYQYVGVWINEKGNLSKHLQFLKEKVDSGVKELLNTAHESQVGSEAIRVRLKLYESTLRQSLTHSLEVWEGITDKEIAELEKIQASALKKILMLPSSTAYVGILMETGLWPVEQFIWYRKLMLYHNIIKSKDSRLAKLIWLQQYKFDMPRSFNSNVQSICQTLGLKSNPDHMALLLKSKWKRQVKERIEGYIIKKFQPSLQSMTKLRFLRDDRLKRKEYVERSSSHLTQKIMSIRLNMCPAKENFRRPNETPLCRLGCEDVENTEHIICCPVITNERIKNSDLVQDDDIELWRRIVNTVEKFGKKVADLEQNVNTEEEN